MARTTSGSNTVRAAKAKLIEVGLRAEHPIPQIVSPLIERSWRRSIGHDAFSGEMPFRYINDFDPESLLLRSAGVVLDRWRDNVSDMRVALFLTDKHGQIVARRLTHVADFTTFDNVGAVEGFDFSEVAVGTNALGTSIEERRPIYVRGTEHFNDVLESLACAGVSIRHPVTGRIVGSIAFASRASSGSPLMLSMAREAGRQIEQRLAESSTSKDMAVAMSYLHRRSTNGTVLILSDQTVMTDVSGLSYVEDEKHALLWERLRSLDWNGSPRTVEIDSMGTTAVAHRIETSREGPIFALLIAGGIRPSRNSPRPSTHRTSHALQSAYAAHLTELDRLATLSTTVTVSGGGGTGKAHLLGAWLASRFPGEEVVFLDSSEFELSTDQNSWFQRAHDPLDSGKKVVVRHLEDMPVADLKRVRRLSDSVRQISPAGTTRVGSLLMFTLNPLTASQPVLDLVPQLSMQLDLPTLAVSRERIPSLANSILHEIAPEDGITLSSAALQALVQWRWPGNVLELRRILEEVVRALSGRIIQLADLPTNVQSTARTRRLSPIAQLERDAIVAALDEACGNRSLAAETLGIGRTTLYRKLRTLGIDAPERMAS
ncbi:helix-turn-helix domain-containing protein [soil metagenome]